MDTYIELNKNLSILRYYAQRKLATECFRTCVIIAGQISTIINVIPVKAEYYIKLVNKILIDNNMKDTMIHYYNIMRGGVN